MATNELALAPSARAPATVDQLSVGTLVALHLVPGPL